MAIISPIPKVFREQRTYPSMPHTIGTTRGPAQLESPFFPVPNALTASESCSCWSICFYLIVKLVTLQVLGVCPIIAGWMDGQSSCHFLVISRTSGTFLLHIFHFLLSMIALLLLHYQPPVLFFDHMHGIYLTLLWIFIIQSREWAIMVAWIKIVPIGSWEWHY